MHIPVIKQVTKSWFNFREEKKKYCFASIGDELYLMKVKGNGFVMDQYYWNLYVMYHCIIGIAMIVVYVAFDYMCIIFIKVYIS